MSMRNHLLAWGAAMSWFSLASYYISTANMKLTFKDLLLMMPQCCEMTDLVGNGYIVFSPETMIKFCFGFVLLHFATWWLTAEEVVEKKDKEVTRIAKYVEKKIRQDRESEDILLESSKSLVTNIDLEFEHCAALIGANNETPGQKVGGEVEWATGETSSEGEDATREVIGAHIKKPSEIEDEKILRCLTYPNDDFDENMSKNSEKEPNLRSDSTSVDYGKYETSWQS